MFYTKLRTNARPILRAMAWMPVAIFFIDHGFSYSTVTGRSMQVKAFIYIYFLQQSLIDIAHL
jgi:hypothetical protein